MDSIDIILRKFPFAKLPVFTSLTPHFICHGNKVELL